MNRSFLLCVLCGPLRLCVGNSECKDAKVRKARTTIDSSRFAVQSSWFRVQAISPDYFKVMGISLIKGRVFTDRDNTRASDAVVINRTMVERYSPGENPLGKRMSIGSKDDPMMQIIGVVDDVRHFGLDSQPRPEFYVPCFVPARRATKVDPMIALRYE